MVNIIKKYVIMSNYQKRDVAQLGSALRSGRRSRRFKSCHPDNVYKFTDKLRLEYDIG